MNKTRSLYKAFGSNLEMPKPNGEKKVKIYNRFGMIAFWGIMVPISVLIGYITYVLTDLLFAFDGCICDDDNYRLAYIYKFCLEKGLKEPDLPYGYEFKATFWSNELEEAWRDEYFY